MERKATLTAEEAQRLKGLFHPKIVSGGYFDKRVAEYDQRSPLTLQNQEIRAHSEQDLAICDRCDLVYQITPSRDVMFEDQGRISVPYCEPCSTTRAMSQL